MRSFGHCLSFGLLAISLFSCSQGSTVAGRPAAVVSGSVTLDDAPIKSGDIEFESDDTEHRIYAGSIKDGRFQLKVEPGPKKVRITAYREKAGAFSELPGPDGEAPRKVPVMEMVVPKKYNEETELKLDVVKEGNKDVLFELKSK